MDDKTFQAFLLDTQVMLTKDHGKWNFETLQDLVEGPLHNPKRMEEAIKVSRYIRKLMSFFHPMAHRFSALPKTKVGPVFVSHIINRRFTLPFLNQQNVRWVRLGCSLLNALLASQDGVKFLAEDEFLSQLYKSFDQLDPVRNLHVAWFVMLLTLLTANPDAYVRSGVFEEAHARHAYVRLFRDARYAKQAERGNRVRQAVCRTFSSPNS